MQTILNFLEEIAVAKRDSNLITEAQLTETAKGFNTLRSNHRTMASNEFQEVITGSAFNTYMTDAIDRMFYDQYGVVGGTWRTYTTPDKSNDLREVTRYAREQQSRMQKRRSTGSRRQTGLSVTPASYGAAEYSDSFELAWETILNDDLGELKKIPTDMALGASTFEDRFVSSLYNNATTQAFLVGLGANYAGASALDKASLIAGLTAMTTRRTTNGTDALIRTGAITLVVGQALAYTAAELFKNILAYGTDESNILAQFIGSWTVDPNIVEAGGFQPWYLFANPSVITTVPVLRLTGVDKPYVFTQESQVRVVSGSAPAALTMANYDSGVLSYSVATIIGGNDDANKGGLIDPNGIYYNAGG